MFKRAFIITAIVAAATIGEGVFVLPYIIQTSGWGLSLAYFIALIVILSLSHVVYLQTLHVVGEKERLLGLARKYYGSGGFWIGFVAIVIGLLLGFVAYLVLGARFLTILFPNMSAGSALGIFWFILACLIWGSEGKIAWLEVTGISLISGAIFFIFFTGHPGMAFANVPFIVPGIFFLPFGAVLFSLAGWTSVEQVYEFIRSREGENTRLRTHAIWIFMAGTAFAAVLYWLFAIGVLNAAPHVAIDTISGIGGWPVWKRDILAVIGISAACVVSLPLAREMRGAMEKDLGWNTIVSRSLIAGLPLAAVLSGFNNFLIIVSVAGGVFLSTQYLLIISVARRALVLSSSKKLSLDMAALLFTFAAVYSIYVFIVR
jgi:hypothetical protein